MNADEIVENKDFLSHIAGGKVNETDLAPQRPLPKVLEGFDTFSASATEVLAHKRRDGRVSTKVHAGK